MYSPALDFCTRSFWAGQTTLSVDTKVRVGLHHFHESCMSFDHNVIVDFGGVLNSSALEDGRVDRLARRIRRLRYTYHLQRVSDSEKLSKKLSEKQMSNERVN